MEDWELENYKKLKEYIKKGWVSEDAKVEYLDGDSFIREEYVLIPIGVVNDCGCMPSAVLWL